MGESRTTDAHAPLEGQTIVIRGDTIEAVGTDLAIPPGATVIDLSDAVVLPGLIDSHVHITPTPEAFNTALTFPDGKAAALNGLGLVASRRFGKHWASDRPPSRTGLLAMADALWPSWALLVIMPILLLMVNSGSSWLIVPVPVEVS